MKQFKFSDQGTAIKSNEKKVSIREKIWASLNLISLMGDMMIPSKMKKKIPLAQRNIIILLLLVILIYLVGCGVAQNIKWIIEFTQNSSFALGNYFYYFGFFTIFYLIMDFFNMDEKLKKHSSVKKTFTELLQNANKGKGASPLKPISKTNKLYSALESIMSFMIFIWGVWGIIFYDRALFILLMGLSIGFAIATAQIKNNDIVRKIFIAEIIANVILISFIIINHFYTFLS